MRNTNFKILLFACLSFCLISGCKLYSQAEFVNPLIGTARREVTGAGIHSRFEHGKTYPLVGVPFGMNNWTPQTRESEKRGIQPYEYDDTGIQGFRNSHYNSGSAAKDYGTFTIMPLSGQLITGAKDRASDFSHDKEVSSPMYYFDRSFIWHDEIVKGGKLVFVMGDQPNKVWASGIESIPPSIR